MADVGGWSLVAVAVLPSAVTAVASIAIAQVARRGERARAAAELSLQEQRDRALAEREHESRVHSALLDAYREVGRFVADEIWRLIRDYRQGPSRLRLGEGVLLTEEPSQYRESATAAVWVVGSEAVIEAFDRFTDAVHGLKGDSVAVGLLRRQATALG